MASLEIAGQTGELVERLIALINTVDEDWSMFAMWTSYALGGPELEAIIPAFDEPPEPGTMGARAVQENQQVDRTEFLDRIRRRLNSLIQSGLREDFVIPALRDELTDDLRQFANSEAADTKRQETRDKLAEMATDPDRLRAFREALKESDPNSELTDTELMERLRAMADSDLWAPVEPDERQRRWSSSREWTEAAERLLSDAEVQRWRDQASARAIRGFRGQS